MDLVQRLLINRNFALFSAGSFVGAMGSWFQSVAIGWLVLELTNSSFMLGMSSFMQLAPVFFLGFFGGVLADRVDRRTLLLSGLGTGAVAITTLAWLALAGRAGITTILAASLVLGVVNAVVWPTWQPFVKEIVPHDRLRQAIAFNSARFNLTRVLGPALAGVLLARTGAPVCLVVAAIGSATVVLSTWLIRRERGVRARSAPASWSAALVDGFGYLRGDGFACRLLLVTAAYGLLVMPYQALLPALARDVLGTGATGLGILLAAIGGGAVVGAILTGTSLVARRPGLAMAIFGLLGGAGLTGFANLAAGVDGPARAWLPPLALALTGFGSIGYLTAGNSTLQLRVPDAVMGRVMALWVVVNAGTMPLGSLALGAAAERAGLLLVVQGCGLLGIALGAFTLLTKAFAGSREQPPPTPPEHVEQATAGVT